ncbi:ribosomal protein L16p/L10e [Seiridium cupressi]
MASHTYLSLAGALRGLTISATRPSLGPCLTAASRQGASPILNNVRCFSATTAKANWLEPRLERKKKMMKGRPRVPTGGSIKGTTVAWGDFGLRMTDHHRRISAQQLKVAEDTIKARLRGEKYRLYKRVNCDVGVFVSGNEIRMGKGKGSFDHWATRVAINQIVLELKGMVHEQIVRDAFRLAGNKLPGQWEFVKKGEPPMVGITKLDGVTLEELKRPRRKVDADKLHPVPSPSTTLEAEKPLDATPPGDGEGKRLQWSLCNAPKLDFRKIGKFLRGTNISHRVSAESNVDLWDRLGLSIKCTELTHDPKDDADPNLLFEIEHPDKSSALLSPPHIQTSTINGLACSLEYGSTSSTRSDSGQTQLQRRSDQSHRRATSAAEQLKEVQDDFGTEDSLVSSDLDADHAFEEEPEQNRTSQQRRAKADLAVAALHKIIGVKKKFPGIPFGPSISPTVLGLAPSVCNAHYMKVNDPPSSHSQCARLETEQLFQTTAAYANKFLVMSDIITKAGGWRPSLQQKLVELTNSGGNSTIQGTHMGHAEVQTAIQKRLWTLLHSSLDHTIGMDGALRKINQQTRRLELEQFESQLFPGEIVHALDERETENSDGDIFPFSSHISGEYRPDQSVDCEPNVDYIGDTSMEGDVKDDHGHSYLSLDHHEAWPSSRLGGLNEDVSMMEEEYDDRHDTNSQQSTESEELETQLTRFSDIDNDFSYPSHSQEPSEHWLQGNVSVGTKTYQDDENMIDDDEMV